MQYSKHWALNEIVYGEFWMKPVYVDIHIHTSMDPNHTNDKYNTQILVRNIRKIAKEYPVLLCLSDHNTINKKAYKDLINEDVNVILGAELHIRKYDNAPPYHCHILFNLEITDENIDNINKILDRLYPNKVVTDDMDYIPNIEQISNEFDSYEFMLLPHGGQSHRTFDKATGSGHRFDNSMERSVYYNHFEGFTARSNSGLKDTEDYFKRLGISDFTNLITCTDNYNPVKYPDPKSDNAESFIPTWILSEPTFQGLRLALSEKTRLKYSYNPPENWHTSITDVKLDEDNCKIDVKLSPGLNVVIGGSSSGKTLFVDSLMSGIKGDFSLSKYTSFGVERIIINNPTKIYPHYINQNFIISVLNNDELTVGDIDIVREVFPEDKQETETIRKHLSQVKMLINELVDSVSTIEKSLEQLSHIESLSSLIMTTKEQKKISDYIKPGENEKTRFNLQVNEFEEHFRNLEKIQRVFEISKLELPYKTEITTLKEGLQTIFQVSQLNSKILNAVSAFVSYENDIFAEESRETVRINTQRDLLTTNLSEILKALRIFDERKKALAKFNVQIKTKEIDVRGHKLSIENSFELSDEILKQAVNSLLKAEHRIDNFLTLRPENLFKVNFSQRPKVNGYDDFATKIYNAIEVKNKRTYHIKTKEGHSFDSLSPGWKSAVLLDLILGYTEDTAPLIIDQPEDNLATDYINHGLIENIMRIKPDKQVILVSHNATIPMIGDAQTIILCENDNGLISIKSAPLESDINGKRVVDLIAEITDGGKPSIRKRVKKYDLKKYNEQKEG